jgi:hypothetical protein
VIGEAGVPPDAEVDRAGKIGEAVLVCAGFLGGAILVDEIGAGDEHGGGFALASVHVHGGFEGGAAGDVEMGQTEDEDDIVAGAGELGLGKEREKAVVAAVSVDDDDFFAAVAGHLGDCFLEEGELGGEAVGDGAGLLASFKDLAEVVGREDDGVLLLDGVEDGEADVEEVGAKRQVGAVFLNDAEGEDADALGLVNSGDEVGGGEFFPLGERAGPCEEGEGWASVAAGAVRSRKVRAKWSGDFIGGFL